MKKLLRTILASILAVATLFCFTACNGDGGDGELTGDLKKIKDAGKIVVGITDYEPMDYKLPGSNEWIGFDAELAEMFAASLGVTCEFFEIADWGAKAIELQSNSFDLIWNGMTATDELGQQIDLSVPYAKNAQVLVMKKDATAPSLDAVKDLTIAVESGSAGNKVAANEIKVTNLFERESQMAALLEVVSGDSQGALIDLTMAESVVGKNQFADLKIVEGISYGDEVFSVGLRKGSNLTAKINEFLKAKYADGTMTKLLEKYAVSINVDALK